MWSKAWSRSFSSPKPPTQSLEQVVAVFGDNLQADKEDLRRQVQRKIWAETSVQSQSALEYLTSTCRCLGG